MDFTITKYKELLNALRFHNNFTIRHDVDLRPEYSLRIAQVEASLGIKATYYFREMHFVSHATIIKAISALGHAIGYHYENLTTCRGNVEDAYKDFRTNLEKLRHLAPVKTACAHGSPKSPWNSQDIWRKYNIHELGIEYEPMLDTDFSNTLYLTDTGRQWDGYRVSVRDKVPEYQEIWEQQGLSFHSTDEIIHALKNTEHTIHSLNLLINTHPQRWMPFGTNWVLEASMQNIKNIAKRILVCTKY